MTEIRALPPPSMSTRYTPLPIKLIAPDGVSNFMTAFWVPAALVSM
jgi:hypothetical protein